MRKRPAANRKAPAVFGDRTDPRGSTALCVAFLDWGKARGHSDLTIDHHRRYLNAFLRWSAGEGVTDPADVTGQMLDRYVARLHERRRADGGPLAASTRKCYLSPVRTWFRWLARHSHLPHNPAAELQLPKIGRVLPRDILTAAEAEAVLAQPDVSVPLGVRDRAILEMFYSTGVRRSELARLERRDIERVRQTMHVRHGKGNKDRVVPVGSRALGWLTRYENEARPGLAAAGQVATEALFLTHHGEAFTPYRLSQLASGYVAAAELGKRGSCHLFRHTAATLMLENGCDIRFLQALLGHASLTTTQIYTHVSVARLSEAHRATHPAEGGCRRASGG